MLRADAGRSSPPLPPSFQRNETRGGIQQVCPRPRASAAASRARLGRYIINDEDELAMGPQLVCPLPPRPHPVLARALARALALPLARALAPPLAFALAATAPRTLVRVQGGGADAKRAPTGAEGYAGAGQHAARPADQGRQGAPEPDGNVSSQYRGRGEMCPVGTGGGTRRVQLVREGEGEGG